MTHEHVEELCRVRTVEARREPREHVLGLGFVAERLDQIGDVRTHLHQVAIEIVEQVDRTHVGEPRQVARTQQPRRQGHDAVRTM